MKHLILFLITLTVTFSSTIFIGNPQKAYIKPLEEIKKALGEKPKLIFFHQTKIYTDNGALIGLMKNNIQMAILDNNFLRKVTGEELSSQSLARLGFLLVLKGKTQSFVAYQTFFKKIKEDERKSLLDMINKKMKDF